MHEKNQKKSFGETSSKKGGSKRVLEKRSKAREGMEARRLKRLKKKRGKSSQSERQGRQSWEFSHSKGKHFVGISRHHWTQTKPIWGALLSAFQYQHPVHTLHTQCTAWRWGSKRTSRRLRGLRSETDREHKHKDQHDKIAETLLFHLTAHFSLNRT